MLEFKEEERDPNVPQRVYDEIDELKRNIVERVNTENEQPPAQVNPVEAESQPAPAPESAPAPAPESAPAVEAKVEPVFSSSPSPTATAAATEEDPEEERKASARYDSLKGKYEKELGEKKAALERAAELERQLEEIRFQKPNWQELGIDPDIAEALGEDTLKAFDKLAQKRASASTAELESLRNEIVQLRQFAYQQKIASYAPDWRSIDEQDPQFHAWLNEKETIGGRTRRDNLIDANNRMDADTVGRYFLAYKDTKSATASPQAAPLATPAVPRQVPRVEMPAPEPKQESVPTFEEVDKALDLLSKGIGDEEEVNKKLKLLAASLK